MSEDALTTDSISDEADRDHAYCKISKIQAEKGDPAGAKRTAQKIERYRQYYSEAMIAVVVGFAQADQVDQAIKAANQIKDSLRKAEALLNVATVVARCGDKQRARFIAEGITFLQVEDGFGRIINYGGPFDFRDKKS